MGGGGRGPPWPPLEPPLPLMQFFGPLRSVFTLQSASAHSVLSRDMLHLHCSYIRVFRNLSEYCILIFSTIPFLTVYMVYFGHIRYCNRLSYILTSYVCVTHIDDIGSRTTTPEQFADAPQTARLVTYSRFRQLPTSTFLRGQCKGKQEMHLHCGTSRILQRRCVSQTEPAYDQDRSL